MYSEIESGIAQHKNAPGKRPDPGHLRSEPGLSSFFALIRRELTAPLTEIADIAAKLADLPAAGLNTATLADEMSLAKLAGNAQRSADFIRRLFELGDLLVDEHIPNDERLLLVDVLNSVSGELVTASRARGVGIRVEDSKAELGPVYGSQRWLSLALRYLIHGLLDASPQGAHLLLRLRQVGMHQLISGTIQHGRPTASSRDLLHHSHGQHPVEILSAGSRGELDMAMAHAIIELHGGMFKIDSSDSGQIYQFTFTLPTGSPVAKEGSGNCAICPIKKQSLQYASDLATLMASQSIVDDVR